MSKLQVWELSDAFWAKAEPLIPRRKRNPESLYQRKPGGGRKPKDPRLVLEGILYVLRTGCQWKALPKERFGSASSIHNYFSKWLEAGFFLELWKAGLGEYDEFKGIEWEWQSIDGAMVKAPLVQESVGKNPTDRGIKWDKTKPPCGWTWSPIVDRRVRSKQA